MLETYSELNLLYDKSNYSCHHEGHHLGWWLYDYTKDLKEALNYATLLCGGSNFHGIFQSYFEREHQDHNVDKNQIKIADLCPIGQENVNWMHERDCIHGIGHGLTKLYNYNTTATVGRCNEFMPLWAQSACSRGIFMENNDHFLETGKGDFDNNDIYSPCDRPSCKICASVLLLSPYAFVGKKQLNLYSQIHMLNAIISLQTNLSNIVMRVLAGIVNN